MSHEHLIINLDVGAAIVVLLIALVLWFRLRFSVERRLWWAGMVTLVIIVFHCAGHFTDTLFLTHITAITNAALVLVMVNVARKSLKKNEILQEEVVEQQQVIEQERSAAQELAHVLADYRSRIEALERLIKEKNGGSGGISTPKGD